MSPPNYTCFNDVKFADWDREAGGGVSSRDKPRSTGKHSPGDAVYSCRSVVLRSQIVGMGDRRATVLCMLKNPRFTATIFVASLNCSSKSEIHKIVDIFIYQQHNKTNLKIYLTIDIRPENLNVKFMTYFHQSN